MVVVKICGNTRAGDAVEALKLGADLVGVIVEVPVKTPRKVSLERAKEIFSAVPKGKRVMVLMPSSVDEVLEFYHEAKPDYVQLHGGESQDFIKELQGSLRCKIIKTIHVSGKRSIKEAETCAPHCDILLLDTPSKTMGGSGMRHDWVISKKIVLSAGAPVILAGGLSPKNVAQAVRMVGPYGVDVSSGVETRPGKKDYLRVKNFIEAAKGAYHGDNG
jgi:phosphoribosylanthranilate isomerase